MAFEDFDQAAVFWNTRAEAIVIVENLTDSADFPAQGAFLGRRVRVMFGYQRPEFKGVIVRDDAAAPGLLIIRLDDGRHVLSLECQYGLEK